MKFAASLLLVISLFLPAMGSATGNNPSVIYGPPFNSQYLGAQYYPTLSEAMTATWPRFMSYWGLQAGHCGVSWVKTYPSGVISNVFAQEWVNGDECDGAIWYYGTAYAPKADPGKNNGSGCGCDGGEGGGGANEQTIGDPINITTGNKYLEEVDYAGGRWLTFRRLYNGSPFVLDSSMGANWGNSFNRFLQVSSSTSITLFRPDGKYETFVKNNGAWLSDADSPDKLIETDNAQGTATGYTVFIAAKRDFEAYNTLGQLLSVTDEAGQGITLTYSTSSTPASIAPTDGLLVNVTDSKGRELNFSYNVNSTVNQIKLPDGGALTYGYDADGNLQSVQYPDGRTRQYVYNESSLTGGANLPGAMTGIVDEAGTRYESTTYNSNGQAISSSLANGADQVQIAYNSDGTSSVTYALGAVSNIGLATDSSGRVQTTSASGACGIECSQTWKAQTYDANGYPASYIDFNGNLTKSTYDTNGLLNQQIDASGTTSQRTANFTWNTALRVPLTRTVLDANGNTVSNSQWVYNSIGQPLARCEIDPTNSAASVYSCSNTGTVPAGVRRWTYTYCTAVDTTQCPIVGLMLAATGPRIDTIQTITYRYYLANSTTNCGTPGAACYQAGDLHTVTDPQGHVTTIASYDADGRPTRITDANGVNTDLTYAPRGWLATRSVGGAQTSFGYTPYGAVQTVTDADGVSTTYGYDAAHRLVKITDAQGNYVQYTLDAVGDKTAEQVYDSTGTLHKSLVRTFNTLGQLTKVMDGLTHTVFDASASGSYDANGNLILSTDGLGIQRQLGYDALNRLVQTLDNYNGTN